MTVLIVWEISNIEYIQVLLEIGAGTIEGSYLGSVHQRGVHIKGVLRVCVCVCRGGGGLREWEEGGDQVGEILAEVAD